jgi:hypothetical protein
MSRYPFRLCIKGRLSRCEVCAINIFRYQTRESLRAQLSAIRDILGTLDGMRQQGRSLLGEESEELNALLDRTEDTMSELIDSTDDLHTKMYEWGEAVANELL